MGAVVQRFTTFHVDDSGIQERPDGSIIVQGQITHPGVFTYRQDGKVIKEYRPDAEVFSEASMASFEDVALTLDHPKDRAGRARKVTASSWKADALGHVRNVRREGGNVVADLVVKDPGTVASIRGGKLRELSCGYNLEVDETPGTAPDGTRYDAVHRNIVGNHVALLPRGRARGGEECKLRVDGNEEFPGEESGIGISTLPSAMPVSEAEFATMTVRLDALEAENAQLKAERDDGTRMDALVEERAGLVSVAKTNKIETKGKTNRQIKAAIVAAFSPSLAKTNDKGVTRADALDEDALDAAFTAVMERPAPPTATVRTAQVALAAAVGGPPATRHDSAAPSGGSRIAAARQRNAQNQAGAYSPPSFTPSGANGA